MAARFLIRTAGLTLLLQYAALLVEAGSCGTVGGLRRPDLIERFRINESNKVTLLGKCEKACLNKPNKCRGFSINSENRNCQLFGNIMEKMGMSRSDDFNILHYDMPCFVDTPTSSSTQQALNLDNETEPFTCIPNINHGIFNPSFEEGIWISYSSGWSFHGSTDENKPVRDAGGLAADGNVTMSFDVTGSGTSSVSQTLCVAPRLKYELTALVGHKTHERDENFKELHYHAPTLSIYLDRNLVYRNSICGPSPRVRVTECQLDDGGYFPISVLIQPLRATPNLTFEFSFDAPEGQQSFRGLLDLVQLHTAEPPI